MNISLRKNFLFIHIPKTAGSSISILLKPYSISSNRTLIRRFSSYLPFEENIQNAYFRQHTKGTTFNKKINSDVFNNLYKFAVVRNPYDHVVSYFSFIKKTRSGSIFKQYKSWTFEDFISYLEKRNKQFEINQSSWIVDKNQNFLVDRILFFEHLEKDFKNLTDYLNLGDDIKLPHFNKTERFNYHDYYNDNLKLRVKNIYAKDFDKFGYIFETPSPQKCPIKGYISV